MNYATLVTAVQDYLENTFSTVDMNTFIKQAETRVYNSVNIPALRKNVIGAFTISSPYLSCPDDFLAVYSMAVIYPVTVPPVVTNTYAYLLNKDVSFIREAYPAPTDVARPKYYALFGSRTSAPNELSFIVGPTPDSDYSVELHYFYYPESITTVSGGETWLGDNYDPLLLYGTLVEAYTFMKGEADMLAQYEAKYQQALAQLKRLCDGMERQDAYRNGQARLPVN